MIYLGLAILNHVTFPALIELPTLSSVCTICCRNVGNIGTIGTNGITNGTIGKTLNGICLPMVPFLPLGKTTNARHMYICIRFRVTSVRKQQLCCTSLERKFVCLFGFNVAFNIICHITTVSGCDRELNAHFYSAASLWYQILDTLPDITSSHIILTPERPVLALPRKSERQAFTERTLYLLSYRGR